MELSAELSARAPLGRRSAVCVGTFDGVHLGHRALLDEVMRIAADRSLASVAITFRQQPRSVIQPGHAARYLCPLEQRLQLLEETGLDYVTPVDFDHSVRNLTASEFLRLVMDTVGMAVLVIGPGARQGRDRLGSEELIALGSEMGFVVAQARPAELDDASVSSSLIRESLESGMMERASEMLGREFSLYGTVVQGERRGRDLGYPTANLAVPQDCALPADGIYATRAVLDDGRHFPAATSIGFRPTFGGCERTIEAFLLDFGESIYGRGLTLRFVRRLRDEIAFAELSELTKQIERDVADTRALLGAAL